MDMKICKVEGCSKKVYGRGRCVMHYRKFIYDGRLCSVDGCNKQAVCTLSAYGDLCAMHRSRLYRGQPLGDGTYRHRRYHSFVSAIKSGIDPLGLEFADRDQWTRACRAYYGDKCARCGWDIAGCDVHHRIPMANGGKHTIGNGEILCPNCHRIEHPIKRGNHDSELIRLLSTLSAAQ